MYVTIGWNEPFDGADMNKKSIAGLRAGCAGLVIGCVVSISGNYLAMKYRQDGERRQTRIDSIRQMRDCKEIGDTYLKLFKTRQNVFQDN